MAFNTGLRGRMHGGPGLLDRIPGGSMGPSQRQRRFRRSARSGLRIPTVDSSIHGGLAATMVRLLKSAVARPGRAAAARKLKGTPGQDYNRGPEEHESTMTAIPVEPRRERRPSVIRTP